MEDNFASRMVQLRKEAGLSQKDAAAGLLISQALLSHYEKGIRECGLGFVVRAAEFYSVTCDYILGRSSNKHSIEGDLTAVGDIPEDTEFNMYTALRVIMLLRNLLRGFDFYKMRPDKIFEDKYVLFATLSLYKLLLSAVKSGELPAEWIGNREIVKLPFYTEIINASIRYVLDSQDIQNRYTPPDMPTPQCVLTFVQQAENIIANAWSEISKQIER